MTDFGIQLNVASDLEWSLAAGAITRCHYLRTFPDPRGMPVVLSITLRGEWVGCLVFCRPESNRRYKGELTYGSKEDQISGRARFDRWEVLNLARVWLSPDVQAGGRLCHSGVVPGFTDRKGAFRTTFASTVVRMGIESIKYYYLMIYPPCFLLEPYQIRVVLSYCDTRVHRGVLYRASGFAPAGTNRDGVETWYFDRISPLDQDQDEDIRLASRRSDRSARKRHARGSIGIDFPLFGGND